MLLGQCSRERLVGYMTWLLSVMSHSLVILLRLDLLKYYKTSHSDEHDVEPISKPY